MVIYVTSQNAKGRRLSDEEPWSPGQATDEIRAMGRSKRLSITYKLHAQERLAERDIIISDVLFVLKNGFVFKEPLPSTRPGLFRYGIETTTPNSGGRQIRVVIVPDKSKCWIKIVSVMWVDETSRRAGTLLGVEDEN